MHRLASFGWLLVITSCVRLNPSYGEAQTDGASASGGKVSSTGESSATSDATFSGSGASTAVTATSKGVDTTGDATGTSSAVEFTDDAWEEEFAAAEDLGSLGWNEDSVQLIGTSEESILESRIFDAGSDVHWQELRWTPRAPYKAPLQFPIDEDEFAYATGNTSVAGLQLLLHLEDGPFPHDNPLEDATGLHAATWVGAPNNDPSNDIRGVFGRGLSHDDDNNMDAHRIQLADAVEPGLGPFTWTVWYRAASCSNMYMVALDSEVADGTAGLYFLACGGHATLCPDNDPSHAIGYIRDPDQPVQTQVCSDAVIGDNRWHHLALRRTIAGPGQNLQLFVDGELSGEIPRPNTFITDVSVHPDIAAPEDFTLAGGNEGLYSGAGAYDEFALWNRALDPAEIENLYRRGTRVARFQVRACDQPDCNDEDFMGLGGLDINAGYVDPGLQAGHTVSLSDLDLHGRYVQYRFLLQRPTAVPSPAIEAVTVSGTRQ